MSKRRRGFLIAAAIVVAMGGAALTLSQVLLGAQEGGRDPGYLLAPGRRQLSICVDSTASPGSAAREVDRVSKALDSAFASVEAIEIPPEYAEPSFAEGCPPPIPLTEQYLTLEDRHPGRYSTVVRDPALLSPHRLFVYFVPQETFTAAFGDRPHATASVEILCEGSACAGVTGSLYVPASAGSAVLEDGLLEALALHPRRFEPEPTLDWHACERGDPDATWCEKYEFCTSGTPELGCDEFWEDTGLEPPQ